MINTALCSFGNVLVVDAVVVISHYGRDTGIVFGLFSLLVVVVTATTTVPTVTSVVGVHFCLFLENASNGTNRGLEEDS